jgi:hypothetical protein
MPVVYSISLLLTKLEIVFYVTFILAAVVSDIERLAVRK